MSDVMVAVPLPDGGEVQMPFDQALTIGRLSIEHPDSSWHFNECGCCVCLHPGGEKTRGWIIGSDGEAEYHEVAHG